jgi:hypothetical protein
MALGKSRNGVDGDPEKRGIGRDDMGMISNFLKGGIFGCFLFYVRYSTLLHLPPVRFHCVGGC